MEKNLLDKYLDLLEYTCHDCGKKVNINIQGGHMFRQLKPEEIKEDGITHVPICQACAIPRI